MVADFRSGACLVTAALRVMTIRRGRTVTLPGGDACVERVWPTEVEPDASTSVNVTS